MKLLKMTFLYLFFGGFFFGIGFWWPFTDITVIDGEDGDCFYKDNPMTGIFFVEYYAIKSAMQIDRYDVVDQRLKYFLEEQLNFLLYVTDNYSCINCQKNICLINKIMKELDSHEVSEPNIRPPSDPNIRP